MYGVRPRVGQLCRQDLVVQMSSHLSKGARHHYGDQLTISKNECFDSRYYLLIFHFCDFLIRIYNLSKYKYVNFQNVVP